MSVGWVIAALACAVAFKFWLKAWHYEDLWRETMRCWEKSTDLYARLLANRKGT